MPVLLRGAFESLIILPSFFPSFTRGKIEVFTLGSDSIVRPSTDLWLHVNTSWKGHQGPPSAKKNFLVSASAHFTVRTSLQELARKRLRVFVRARALPARVRARKVSRASV